MIDTPGTEVVERTRLKGEGVFVFPLTGWFSLLQLQAFAGAKQTKYSGGIGLFAAVHSEWIEKQFPKSNIGQPGFFQIDEQG